MKTTSLLISCFSFCQASYQSIIPLMNYYSCPVLNPSLSFSSRLFWCCVSLSSSLFLCMLFLAYCPLSQMVADLGDVSLLSPHMEPLRWAERLLIPPNPWRAGANPKPRSAPCGGHIPLTGWPGVPAPGGWAGTTHKSTESQI